MLKFYGPVGTGQTSLTLPFPMRLSWTVNQKVYKITCHSKVSASLRTIFEKTLKHYGQVRITALGLDKFSGCLNVRPTRSGTTWSKHAWGAAVDLDDENNMLKMDHRQARFASMEYEAFWKIVESEGWVSLGRSRDFDWMHFQAARL